MNRGLANIPRLVRAHIIGSVRNLQPIKMAKWSVPRANWRSIGLCALYKHEGKTIRSKHLKKVEGV